MVQFVPVPTSTMGLFRETFIKMILWKYGITVSNLCEIENGLKLDYAKIVKNLNGAGVTEFHLRDLEIKMFYDAITICFSKHFYFFNLCLIKVTIGGKIETKIIAIIIIEKFFWTNSLFTKQISGPAKKIYPYEISNNTKIINLGYFIEPTPATKGAKVLMIGHKTWL